MIDPFKAIAEQLRSDGDFGVYVGRFCPMHLGHQPMIGTLIEAFGDKHVVFIGSCNKPVSIRHLFSYEDRGDFIRAVHPEARIMPLPDFESDRVWFRALDDILRAIGADPGRTVFIGGSKEDVEFFFDNGRRVSIINRYNGPTLRVSASEVRDTLIGRRPLKGLLDEKIIPLVEERFEMRWNEVRSR